MTDRAESTPSPAAETVAEECFSRRAWIFFTIGMVLLVLGHVCLAMAGRVATDSAGRLAPFLIVLGYAVFGLGFWPKRRSQD